MTVIVHTSAADGIRVALRMVVVADGVAPGRKTVVECELGAGIGANVGASAVTI